jgi:microcystin-dependent protein
MPVFGGDTPVGAGMIWYTNTAPANWLICDGTAVSRTTYGALFAVLGTTYGTGNGSTTFNLPDLRQRFPMGKAASGTGNSLAGTGGAIDHTHSVPAHYHGMGTGADLAVSNSPSGYSAWGGSSTTTAPKGDTSAGSYAASTITGRIGLVTGGEDGNAAMTSGTQNPPYLVVNYIIKAA